MWAWGCVGVVLLEVRGRLALVRVDWKTSECSGGGRGREHSNQERREQFCAFFIWESRKNDGETKYRRNDTSKGVFEP